MPAVGKQTAQIINWYIFQLFRQFSAAQHGIKALDGADADARGGVDGVALQPLDDVFLGKLEVVVGRIVLLEFLQRLVGEVAAINQEQHALCSGELYQAIDEADAGKGFAGAGGHLDQGARAILPE